MIGLLPRGDFHILGTSPCLTQRLLSTKLDASPQYAREGSSCLSVAAKDTISPLPNNKMRSSELYPYHKGVGIGGFDSNEPFWARFLLSSGIWVEIDNVFDTNFALCEAQALSRRDAVLAVLRHIAVVPIDSQ